MSLWIEWFRCIHLLHDACSRRRTFLWMTLLRTLKKDLVPSEMVVSYALKSRFFDFLLDTESDLELKKFILKQAQPDKIPGVSAAA